MVVKLNTYFVFEEIEVFFFVFEEKKRERLWVRTDVGLDTIYWLEARKCR